MTTIARAIAAKLTAEELAWVKMLVGADLRDAEAVQSLVDVARAFADYREAFVRTGRSQPSENDLVCSFCGGNSSDSGPIYCRDSMAICSVCTAAAVLHFSNNRCGAA